MVWTQALPYHDQVTEFSGKGRKYDTMLRSRDTDSTVNVVLHRFLDNDDIIRLTSRLVFILRDNVLMSLSKRLSVGFFRVIGSYSKYSNQTFTATDNPS